MSENLFVESYNLLDDPRFTEEDSIEQIEALVKRIFPSLSASSLERLVLDILIAHHHHKKDPKDAARAQTITTSIATPITHNPLSDLETPVVISNNTEELPRSNESVHKDELSNPSRAVAPLREPKKKTPFDLLRELLGEDNSNEDIERILAHNDYHLERTVGMLSGKLPDIELNKEQMASRIMCRYFLSGNCIRGSQCMYSHDGSSRICRFWLHQKCIMGDKCIFMHDVPTEVVEEVVEKPQSKGLGLPNLQSLPNLSKLPVLGQKQSKKKNAVPASSYQKVTIKPKLASVKSILGESGRGSAPIMAPRSTPWVSKNEGVNSQYVELRLSAAGHADIRNKFLQESTNAWSFNDAAKAKVLSAKGRDAEQQMIEKYRNAADLLWEHQLKPGAELWVDLHGLELMEAIDELESKLIEVAKTQRHMPRIMYVISGRGHFKAKKYADQLTQYVLAMLDSKGYKHKDFGVDPTFGRITGVDPWSSLTGSK